MDLLKMTDSSVPENSWQDLDLTEAAGEQQAALLRILDANGNRATEGLRVVEDYARFALNDRHLAALSKQLRHELTAALNEIPADARLAVRDTPGDVGTGITEATELQREDGWHVATASAARVQQALRCLEEYSKPLSVELATRFEALRYRMYDLQRSLGITVSSANRLHGIKLYVLLSAQQTEDQFRDRLELLLQAGVKLFQLRDKILDDRQLLSRARIMRKTIDAFSSDKNQRPLMIINDRPDIAVLSSADGVHVGQEELPVADTRAIVGPKQLIGVSTHSIDQARQAVLDGADYIGCGPTFPTVTKSFSHYPGLEFLTEVGAEVSLPAFAIGGINRQRLPEVLETGIERIAVSSALDQAENLVEETEQLLQQLDEAIDSADRA